MCDPEFRAALAAHGYTLDPDTGEVDQLAPYAGAFSARAAQISRNIDRYEAEWRGEHPGQEPGPALRRAWDRRAWAAGPARQGRPRRRRRARAALGRASSATSASPPPDQPGRRRRRRRRSARLNRDAVVDLVADPARRTPVGAGTPPTSAARSNGSSPPDVVADAAVRRELAEDLTARTVDAVRAAAGPRRRARARPRPHLPRVLDVEADLVARLAARAEQPPATRRGRRRSSLDRELDDAQQRPWSPRWPATAQLLVIEGAAGAGQDHHPRRRPRAARDAGAAGWWWSPRP